ncbi:MAG: hypothetical protein EAY75_08335 [Bacteroidetes bacterium]|nr:MAG: hypothetical protein EAY75_08335 [Bacteroidota bacterium]
MKSLFLSTFILLGFAHTSHSQIAITTDGSAAHPSAILHLKSTDKGFLLPRMTTAQRTSIPTPANGLMVYDTNQNASYVFRLGNGWVKLGMEGSNTGWLLTGNSGIDPSSNFLGTNDDAPIVFRVNNIHAGALTANSVHLGQNSGLFKDYNVTDGFNVAVGQNTMVNGQGLRNVAIGANALNKSTPSVADNIAVGADVLSNAVFGANNIGIGKQALLSLNNTAAQHNIALGEGSLQNLVSGFSNIGIGKHSLAKATQNHNVAVGDSAMATNMAGMRNTVMGSRAAARLTNGSELVAIGYEAMLLGGGASNTAVGFQALYKTVGNDNTAVGHAALDQNTLGEGNTVVGTKSLGLNSTGSFNTAVGVDNLRGNIAGSYNVAVGYNVMPKLKGSANVGVGTNLLSQQNIGDSLVLVGTKLSVASTFANKYLTLVGSNMLNAIHTQSQVVGIGNNNLNAAVSGSDNVIIGGNNLNNITSASRVVAIGNNITTGLPSLVNSVAIGNDIDIPASNMMVFGNTATTRWSFGRSSNNVGYALQVGTTNSNGNGAGLTASGTWTNACDSNLKTDVTNIDAEALLEKLRQLPVTQWKYKGTDEYHIGPMAQDFFAIFGLGNNNTSISSVDPAGIALAAVKHLIGQNQQLAEKLDALEQRVQLKLNSPK